MGHSVFISYSTKNTNTAKAICHILEENKMKCWIAPRDIIPGSDYADCIDQAISSCTVFVLVFSGHAQESKWVKGELNVAFDSNKIIVPFRVENVSLHGAMRVILNDKHWLEAYPNPEVKFNELVNLTKKLLGNNSHEDNQPVHNKIVSQRVVIKENISLWKVFKKRFIHKKLKIICNRDCKIHINGSNEGVVAANHLKTINVKDDIVDIEVFSKEYKTVKLEYTLNMNDLGYQTFRIDLAGAEKKHLMKQAEKGKTQELNDLGITFLDEEKYADAQQCFLKASSKGEAAASYNLGMMYHYGKGVDIDYPTCIEFYNKAIEDNYPLALNNLGSMFYNGQGVSKNYKKAFELFYKPEFRLSRYKASP